MNTPSVRSRTDSGRAEGGKQLRKDKFTKDYMTDKDQPKQQKARNGILNESHARYQYVYCHHQAKAAAGAKALQRLDMMIGAHALALGVTLATNNTREFSRIKGLTVVDWLASSD